MTDVVAGRSGPVVVLAGRRNDPLDASVARFPLAQVSAVAIDLHGLFKRRRASALVCAAACGADLVALVAARALGMRRRIVLPFPTAQFREESVTDRPGEWGPLYDALIGEAKAAGDLVILKRGGRLPDPFAATNARLITEALALAGVAAQGRVRGGQAFAAIVWEGTARGGNDYTQGFAELARANRLTVEQVLTTPGPARTR